MTLPTFLVIGAGRAGTTSLYEYLRAHPEVFMSEEKELDYFIEGNWERGRDWYERWFEAGQGSRALGEASPNYAQDPVHRGVPERIAKVLPDVKLIYLVRHPIDRIRSHFMMRRTLGTERMPIAEAVLSHPIYLAASRYAHQIDRYLEHLSRERLLILRTEDLLRDRAGTLRRVYRFIGVNEEWESPVQAREFNGWRDMQPIRPVIRKLRHARGYRRIKRYVPARFRRAVTGSLRRPVTEADSRLPPQVERELRERLREDTLRLREHLGESFDCWGLA